MYVLYSLGPRMRVFELTMVREGGALNTSWEKYSPGATENRIIIRTIRTIRTNMNIRNNNKQRV